MKVFFKTLFFISLFFLNVSSFAQVNLLIEGPEKEIYVGEVVDLKLTLWPVNNEEVYQDLLQKDVFSGVLKVLQVKKISFSQNNSEALVFDFTAAVLAQEMPTSLSINGQSVPLMKRTLSLKDEKPISESVIIFQQQLDIHKRSFSVFLFLIFCAILVSILFYFKLRKSKRFLLLQLKKKREFVERFDEIDNKDLLNFMYRETEKMSEILGKSSWIQYKKELDKFAYKKELSEEEGRELSSSLASVKERVRKWSS